MALGHTCDVTLVKFMTRLGILYVCVYEL